MKIDCASLAAKVNTFGMDTTKFIEAVEMWHKAKGMTQKEFAALVGVAPYHLNAVFRGRAKLTEDTARRLADATGVDFRLYWGGEAPGQFGEYVAIPFRAATASMGPGSFENSRRIKTHLAFREDWVHQKGNPSKMSVIRASGMSMSPTIPDGCLVLIDESQTSLMSGRVYFVALNDELFIKRMVFDRGKWFIESDVDGARIEVQADDNFEPLGRAIWYGCEL